jgi:hypothetical protein
MVIDSLAYTFSRRRWISPEQKYLPGRMAWVWGMKDPLIAWRRNS